MLNVNVGDGLNIKRIVKIKIINMCMSGIHYEIEDEEWEEELYKVNNKLICKYSGLPSIWAYEK
tara:strand:- start:370 stop:561 length:192 start_codon:yes stop_codon:yes gene_type:complete